MTPKSITPYTRIGPPVHIPISIGRFIAITFAAIPPPCCFSAIGTTEDGGPKVLSPPVEVICVFVLRYLFQAYERVKNGSLC